MREGLVVELDGSRGEGGGQILRTALSLSILTQRPLRMTKIRANRAKPGLRKQHLACVQAAARLCSAFVRGAEVGASELEFEPNALVGGVLDIDIGSAGATMLVVQTLLVPAIAGGLGLRSTIRGGTHNPMAPPFEFVANAFLPHLRAMGADVSLTLGTHGFANGGGAPSEVRGEVTLTVAPGGALRPIAVHDAGTIESKRATCIVARLPSHVAERELAIVQKRLGWSPRDCEVREVESSAPANVLLLEITRSRATEVVSVLGERGLRAETVANRACDELEALLAADAPIGEHLADQLLLPMAVAGGGSFRALAPLSLHSTTNIETIRAFLDVNVTVTVTPDGDRAVRVVVGA